MPTFLLIIQISFSHFLVRSSCYRFWLIFLEYNLFKYLICFFLCIVLWNFYIYIISRKYLLRICIDLKFNFNIIIILLKLSNHIFLVLIMINFTIDYFYYHCIKHHQIVNINFFLIFMNFFYFLLLRFSHGKFFAILHSLIY